MEMFKAILREALQSKCHKVSLIDGKMVSFEGSQGENQRQAYGTVKGRWLKELFKALFPKNYKQIGAGETCVGGFSLQGIGKVSMIARVSPESSIWLFMPPDGEAKCKIFWDKLHEQPPAPKPPSPPPPPPSTNVRPSGGIPVPEPCAMAATTNPESPPPLDGGPASYIPFSSGQLPIGGQQQKPGGQVQAPGQAPSSDGFSLQGTEYLDKQDQPEESDLGFKTLSQGGDAGFDAFTSSDPTQNANNISQQSSPDLDMSGPGDFSSASMGNDFAPNSSPEDAPPASDAGGFAYNSSDMFGSSLAQANESGSASQQDMFNAGQSEQIGQAVAVEDPFDQAALEDTVTASTPGYSMDQSLGSQEGLGEQRPTEADLLHMKQSMNTGALPDPSLGSEAPVEQPNMQQPVNHQAVSVIQSSPQPSRALEVDFSNEIPGTISKGDGNNPIDQILRGMIENRASDLHLTIGQPVIFRIDGDICRAKTPNLDSETMKSYILPIMPKVKQNHFAQTWDVDFAYEVADLGRFRVNVFRDYHGVGSVMRHIPDKVLTADQLDLPESIRKLCKLSKGLVLVTGPTGSGKSTTLAAMIDLINSSRSEHILTIEDPIEFVHKQKKCLVNQREVGKHTNSFSTALKAALREDPDIVLVGELRDLETTAIALETAETGHLVFGTLHTNTAISTVDRIIDQFPADQQRIIRNMLASSMKGVIAQSLCKKKQGGRCAAYEILIPNDAVGSMIRESKNHMISNHMQTQQADGNTLMAESLARLVAEDQVGYWEAWAKAIDKRGFEEYAKRKRISPPPPP